MTLLSDTRYIFIRYLTKLVRTPILLFFSLFQPLLFLLLFTQLLGRLSSFPGILPVGVSYLSFATAGIVMMNAFGSALQSGNSIVADIDSGFLQKMLVTPVNRPAILLGRLSSDAFRVVLQTAIILVLAIRFRCAENKPSCHHWSYWNFAYLLHACVLWACVVRNFFSVRHEDEKFRDGFRDRRSHHFPAAVLKSSVVPP